jgi:hypothetical protein
MTENQNDQNPKTSAAHNRPVTIRDWTESRADCYRSDMSEVNREARPPPDGKRPGVRRLAFDYDGALVVNETPPDRPGDRVSDGSIYAGMSPETNGPMYVMPNDVSLGQTWHQAMRYAQQLDAHGHKDWRLPTANELLILFRAKAAIGGFIDKHARDRASYYACNHDSANKPFAAPDAPLTHFCAANMNEGTCYSMPIDAAVSIRLVRTPNRLVIQTP